MKEKSEKSIKNALSCRSQADIKYMAYLERIEKCTLPKTLKNKFKTSNEG